MDIKNLTLDEKIAQMIITGVSTSLESNPTIEKLIAERKIGGVVLFYRNLSNVEKGINLVNALKNANKSNKLPLFIATDQEWGRVNRLDRIFSKLPPARDICAKRNLNLASKAAKITGEILNDLGINMNLAPVLDIGGFDDNKSLGDRCASTIPEEVRKYTDALIKGYTREKIISVAKHFPGNGASKLDSHFLFLPSSNKSLKQLEQKELIPFISAIKNEVPAIMVGHINLTHFNSITPASLSKQVVTGILREKLKYNGVIVTDDLCMASVRFQYGLGYAAIKAVEAGNDILIVKDEKRVEKIIERIKRLVKLNVIPEKRIDESVKRIIKLKETFKLSNDLIKNGIDIDGYNERIENLTNEIDKD